MSSGPVQLYMLLCMLPYVCIILRRNCLVHCVLTIILFTILTMPKLFPEGHIHPLHYGKKICNKCFRQTYQEKLSLSWLLFNVTSDVLVSSFPIKLTHSCRLKVTYYLPQYGKQSMKSRHQTNLTQFSAYVISIYF